MDPLSWVGLYANRVYSVSDISTAREGVSLQAPSEAACHANRHRKQQQAKCSDRASPISHDTPSHGNMTSGHLGTMNGASRNLRVGIGIEDIGFHVFIRHQCNLQLAVFRFWCFKKSILVMHMSVAHYDCNI